MALRGGGDCRGGPLHWWKSGTCIFPVFMAIMGLNSLWVKAQASMC